MLRGSQVRFPYNKIYFACQVAQVQSLFAGCIASAYNGYILVAVKEPVARCTSTYTAAPVFFFVFQTEVFCRGSGCYNNCMRTKLASVRESHFQRVRAEIGTGYYVTYNFCSETFGLLPHIFHKFCAEYSVGVSGEILHFGCCCELPAAFKAFYHNRGHPGTRSVYRRCVSGRPGTYNQTIKNVFHYILLSLFYASAVYRKSTISTPG